MEERIAQFIAALRASGVRVSLAESADAFGAVDLMGIQDREAFRLSLRATLIKDASSLPIFEELFPLFFDSAGPPPLMDLSQDLTPQEGDMLAQALRQFTQQLRQMLEKLLRGEPLSQADLDRLARLTGLNQADDLRYREWMAQRMERALRFQAVQEALEELMQMLAQMGMQAERLEQVGVAVRGDRDVSRDPRDHHAVRHVEGVLRRQLHVGHHREVQQNLHNEPITVSEPA